MATLEWTDAQRADLAHYRGDTAGYYKALELGCMAHSLRASNVADFALIDWQGMIGVNQAMLGYRETFTRSYVAAFNQTVAKQAQS